MTKDVSSNKEDIAAAVSQVSNRTLFQIYTETICIADPPVRLGTVNAVYVRTNTRDMPAAMEGILCGMVTLQKVCHLLAPRSAEASSMSWGSF